MALTAEQLSDFRADIGDDGTVFADAELNRLYERASSDYDQAIVLALRQLLASAAKLHDYQIAHAMERKSQVFDHLQKLLAYRETTLGTAAQQVRITAFRAVPPRDKDTPNA